MAKIGQQTHRRPSAASFLFSSEHYQQQQQKFRETNNKSNKLQAILSTQTELLQSYSARSSVSIFVALGVTWCAIAVAMAHCASAQSISIQPTDFDRLIMPCYLGTSSFGASYSSSSSAYQQAVPVSPSLQASASSSGQYGQTIGRQSMASMGQQQQAGGYYGAAQPEGSGARLAGASYSGAAQAYPAPPPAYGPLPGRAPGDGLTAAGALGQLVPRANTIENFIALLGKIEAAQPRLAQNVDELIRALLGRFRMDNYYYDARSRTPISTDLADRRNSDILPALLSPSSASSNGQQYDSFGASHLPMGQPFWADQALEHDERCSMYFMLSHFIDKTSAMPALSQLPVSQLSGPLQNQRAPGLQVAAAANQLGNGQQQQQQQRPVSSNYPAQSVQQAYSAGSSGPRFSGPSPSFGSPATSQMSQFGAGISNTQAEYAGNNAYGVNSPLPAGPYASSLAAAARSGAQFGAGATNLASQRQALGQPPYIDGQARARSPDDRLAIEYGVVTLSGQSNAALVLNRVLLGILAAGTPAQTLRQLAGQVYSNQQSLNLNTAKADEELDPLFAVTLADLWAVSSIPKAGRPMDFRLLGDNGHWNDSFCPTSFTLERASSIKFTTAELLGGIDGFNLGTLRRRLMSMRRNIKLSEMLRIYYSPAGFRPQFAEIGVCNRYAALSTQLDDLRRQAENYARLMQLNLPTNDNEIGLSINRLDAFREILRQSSSQYAPQSICQDSAADLYPTNGQEACEISRTDAVAVLDSSAQANSDPFMQLVVFKLAQRLGLAARGGSSLSVLTNQLDSSGLAGLSLNTILRNSTNLAEVGCALELDSTRTYQGGQITDPTRLVELFERALVSLDSEYLTRQTVSQGTQSSTSSSSSSSSSSGWSSQRPQTFVSTWYGAGEGNYAMLANAGGPRNTGGSKVILWFNVNGLNGQRPGTIASGPTNWTPGQTFMSSSASRNEENEYKFHEAKKYLRENFRGASILAVSPSRDSVKAFVYDEERDIFTDIPSSSSGLSEGSLDYPQSSTSYGSTDVSLFSGQADQLVGKLVQRICTIPALFQYPMCFLGPSENAQSVGYITPGRKQYWLMAPKTFFASRSIRMAFRVEGGRLRVCFGRKPSPDETALKNKDQQQQQTFQQQAITFSSDTGTNRQQSSGQQAAQSPKASSEDYYTGMNYGVCKEVTPGTEIDFMVSDACYKKSIAECEPFYFVIREISQPGEGDPMYMCRDDGCKRFDQVKFVMTHSGVVCSSAKLSTAINWIAILFSALLASCYTVFGQNVQMLQNLSKKTTAIGKRKYLTGLRANNNAIALFSFITTLMFACVHQARAQIQAGVYDFGQGRYGEKRGSFTPSEWVAIVLIFMLILGGLAITVALCYYVTKRARRGMTPVPQSEF